MDIPCIKKVIVSYRSPGWGASQSQVSLSSILACEQAHLKVARASDEEQSDRREGVCRFRARGYRARLSFNSRLRSNVSFLAGYLHLPLNRELKH